MINFGNTVPSILTVGTDHEKHNKPIDCVMDVATHISSHLFRHGGFPFASSVGWVKWRHIFYCLLGFAG